MTFHDSYFISLNTEIVSLNSPAAAQDTLAVWVCTVIASRNAGLISRDTGG